MTVIFSSFLGLDHSQLEQSISITLKTNSFSKKRKKNCTLQTGPQDKAALFRNLGWDVKVARFALTCVGCWKTWELIRSCRSSIYSFPWRGQGLLSHLSHTAFQGFSNGHLQQITATGISCASYSTKPWLHYRCWLYNYCVLSSFWVLFLTAASQKTETRS